MSFPLQASNEKNGMGDRAYYATYYGDRRPDKYAWLLAEIITYGRPGNIVDLGCGIGLFAELAAQWGLSVCGCDGSADAIELALAREPRLGLTCCALGHQLPYASSSVDNMLLYQVIEHLPPDVLLNVLREGRRILRPEGMLFIFSPNKANRREILADPTHLNPLYPSELRRMLLASGYDIVKEPNHPRFPNSTRTRLHQLAYALARRLMQTRRLIHSRCYDWLSASTSAYARNGPGAVPPK
ncbi:MAG: class I SAM-dependent methyltransferase [Opitutaceae bacterium]